jgi:hypothetical protein
VKSRSELDENIIANPVRIIAYMQIIIYMVPI